MLLADRILFIDGEAMVVDKPAGLPVTMPRSGALSVENHLDSLRFGFARRPGIVHRLDQDTSGCLLLSRNPKAHRRFGAAFEAGLVEKHYLAIVDGCPAAPSGIIDLPLSKQSSAATGWRMVPDPAGKPAVTRWETLAECDGRALLLLRPETGRTHQLRVHAAHGIGLPILGDPVYGGGQKGAAPEGLMMLHAAALRMPRDGKPAIAASAPLPPHFAALGFAEGVPPAPAEAR